MNNENIKPVVRLGIDWLAPFIFGSALFGTIIYRAVSLHVSVHVQLSDKPFLMFICLCYLLVHIAVTTFTITKDELILKKPFIPYLFDKTVRLDEIAEVECWFMTGKTLQPSFLITLKSGKKWRRFTGASGKKVQLFLAELEKRGISTKFST